jgi:cell division protein FtsQ
LRRRKWIILILAVFLVSGMLCLKVREITVTGNHRYTQEQITELLFPDRISKNPVVCYLRDRLGEHKTIPFVEDYDIVFHGPGKVEILLYEKSVVGYVSCMSSYMYFDKDGIVVESTSRKLPDIPEITGLKLGYIALYQKLPVENETIFQEILNLTQILSIHELVVDRVQYNSLGEATLYMGDIEVLLGGNADLNGKIGELNDMVPQLEGRKGTLHLENYDETSQGAGFAFTPRE